MGAYEKSRMLLLFGVIQFTEDSDPSRYEYEWKVVASSSTDDRDKGIILVRNGI